MMSSCRPRVPSQPVLNSEASEDVNRRDTVSVPKRIRISDLTPENAPKRMKFEEFLATYRDDVQDDSDDEFEIDTKVEDSEAVDVKVEEMEYEEYDVVNWNGVEQEYEVYDDVIQEADSEGYGVYDMEEEVVQEGVEYVDVDSEIIDVVNYDSDSEVRHEEYEDVNYMEEGVYYMEECDEMIQEYDVVQYEEEVESEFIDVVNYDSDSDDHIQVDSEVRENHQDTEEDEYVDVETISEAEDVQEDSEVNEKYEDVKQPRFMEAPEQPVFSKRQLQVLQYFLLESPTPSKFIIQSIADCLKLEASDVKLFFENAQIQLEHDDDDVDDVSWRRLENHIVEKYYRRLDLDDVEEDDVQPTFDSDVFHGDSDDDNITYTDDMKAYGRDGSSYSIMKKSELTDFQLAVLHKILNETSDVADALILTISEHLKMSTDDVDEFFVKKRREVYRVIRKIMYYDGEDY